MENETQQIINLTPRERRAVRTRQAIIDAAREIITERGAYGLSLREVARRIDYSPAGLYEYFDGKEELVKAVVADGFEQFGTYLLAISTDLPPDEHFRELGLAYIRFAIQNPQHFMLIFNRLDVDTKPDRDKLVCDGTYQALTSAIQRSIDCGDIASSHDVDAVVFAAWSIVHGMATLLITQMDHQAHNWETSSKQMLNVWYAGLKNS